MVRYLLFFALLAAGAVAAAELQTSPGQQAQNNGFRRCAPTVESMAAFIADGRSHTSIASWHAAEANTRLFNAQMVVEGETGRSVGVVTGVPAAGGRCDGVFTRVTTSAEPCLRLRTTAFRDWTPYSDASGVMALESANGAATLLLLPDAKGGCVAIRTEVRYDGVAR